MKIKYIIKSHICCGCGTCAGICPINAIEMRINERGFYMPKIDERKCNNCGLCSKVCPQIDKEANFNKLNKFVFGKVPDDKLIGKCINCCVGYSTDENIRFEASSGGMITQILISALEGWIIDGAVVTRMKKDNPLIPEPFIARTKEEIISAMGSKYCPVHVNIMLKEIIKSKDDEKFAVVGLPCHILGIRKAELLIPKIQKKIVLHLGLLCSGTKSFFGTEFILERKGIKKENVKNIKYRGNGWPGYMEVNHLNGIMYLPHLAHLYYGGGGFGTLFTNKCCIACDDFTAELSDISVGDAWNIEKEDTQGSSIVILRSKIGEELIKRLSFENKIKLKKIEGDIVMRSQSSLYSKKKLGISNRQNIGNKVNSKIIWLSTSPNSYIRKYFSLSFYILKILINKITYWKK
ncbi:FeS-binding protein [Candidatus Atribacteria bacterium HGW-Atribacteria-1]|nr:MAG: FeS-binding protein [Candidatus Atribacteria bacterium HGW-Atribacteria-1]